MDQDISVAFTEADSDHEMESLICENENEQEVIEENSDDELQNAKKKHVKKLLSDSEEEENEPIINETSQEQDESVPEPLVRKKISALIDSDSEPEPEVSEISHRTIDSSGEDEGRSKTSQKKLKKRSKTKKKSDDILAGLNLDFGSSSESSSDESIAGSAKSSKGSGSDEGLSADEFVRNQGHPDGGKKPQRLSAKEAMENMKVIQSESQRMAREAYVDIPYHKPKQHSLKEFLSRKSVMRKKVPRAGDLRSTAATIKMSQEELEAYEILLKEREKEAAEFFKSESEPEEEGTETISDKNEEETSEVPAVAEVKTNSELLKEMDEALSNAIEQQSEIMSLIENSETVEENPENEKEMEANEEQVTVEEINMNEAPIPESIEPQIEVADVMDVVDDSETVNNTEQQQDEISVPKSPETALSAKLEAKKNKLRSLLGDLPEIKPLTCDPSLVIDLETGDIVKKELTGPELLKEKYIKNAFVKSQVPHDTDLAIVSLENGLHVEHVILKPDTDTFKVKKDVKPGAAYVKLKQELEKKMTESRMKSLQEREGYAKKLEEEQELYSGDEEGSDIDEDEACPDEDQQDPTEIEAVTEVDIDPMNDDEQEASNSDSSLSDSSDEEDLPDPICVSSKKSSRIIKAFVDSDDETDKNLSNTIQEADISLSDSLPLGQVMPSDIEGTTLLETSMSDTSFKVPETPDAIENSQRPSMELLWDATQVHSKDDELSELCSGRFGPTQVSNLTQNPNEHEAGIKALCDKGLTQAINDEDLSELCSGTFVTQVPDPKVKETVNELVETEIMFEKISPEKVLVNKRNVILSSSDDEEKTEEGAEIKKVKKLKKKKKRRQALEISDDESSESENEEDEIEAEESPVEDPEEPEIFMDYDSEENEIEVKLTKQDRQKVATNYFENEAELSGSEYGSADEDEKDLDRFEKELGDEEQFDHDQLQSELGKIHMRRILDQDNREVKILQEMFFEDEEKDGIGRTRKFMWKNVDGVMNLMDGGDVNDLEQQGHHSEDENEEEYRKMRHEREALLAKNNDEKENALQLSVDNETAIETSVTKKRFTIVRKQNTTDSALNNKNNDSPFLISFDTVFKESRASFLTRDEETLNKLAGMVREKDGDAMASALGKARNFVFSVVTPPQAKEGAKQTNKRSSDAGGEELPGKRQKVEKSDNKFKKRLLDSLA